MGPRLEFLWSADPTTDRPIQASFEHRAPGGEGEVELQYWPHADLHQPPEQLTLFILGNPGLLSFYTVFLNHFRSLLPSSHAILATSHTGHSTRLPPPPRAVELLGLLEAKVELVSALREALDTWGTDGAASSSPSASQRNRPRLALMSHSVGGWLSMETMKRANTPAEPDTVHAAYMICPTVGWIANTWNGWKLWPLFHRPLRPIIPHLARLLPPLFPLFSLPTATLEFLRNPRLIDATLILARTEMLIIREPDVEWFTSQNSEDTTRGVFACWSKGNGDMWVGSEGPMCQEALGAEEGGRVVIMDGVPHAYCLTEAHSKLVAGIVAAWIVPAKNLPSGFPAGSTADPPLSETIPL